jgi:hypothetical protein
VARYRLSKPAKAKVEATVESQLSVDGGEEDF